jgi:hypothetical protein
MEPNKISTVNDLHNEGVDIMGDAGADQDGVTQVPVQMPAPAFAPAQTAQVPRSAAFIQPTSMQMPSSAAQDEINRTLGINNPAVQGPVMNAQNDPSIKSVRTFKSDAEEAIRYGNVSATKISLAEQNRKIAREQAAPAEKSEEGSSALGKIAVALTIMVILAAAGGYYFVYMKKGGSPAAALPQQLRVDTILPYAKASVLQLDGQTDPIESFAALITSTAINAGTIHAFIPVPYGTTTVVASIEDIFGGTDAPSTLKRSLSSRYMLGAYAQDTKLPFIILKNTYFQNTFAGMLEWEKNMRKDLIQMIRISNPAENASLSNSSAFEDSVISNVDARVLKNDAGEVILAYAFSDKDTLIIATRADSLKIILDKLLAVRVVQ